jgi:plasmid rolling circle replication initiator protein Rep
MWQARIHRALPKLIADFPQARFLFVTFTLKNCDPNLLRLTLKLMQQAWKRLILLKAFPAIGWMRSMEVTRGRDGNAHPHFHTLLMVQPEYFKAGYLKQSEWAEMWRKCLRIDYKPVVHIVAVDPQHEPWRRSEVTTEHAVWNAATEVMKYFMKVSDMLSDDKWMLTVSDEVWKMRAVALGGVFKTYLKDRRREDLRDEPEADLLAAEPQQIYFNWKQLVRRYKKFA